MLKFFSFYLILIISASSHAQSFYYGDSNSPLPPIVILGDNDYAPIEWLENGQAKGIFPSVLPALAKKLNRKIEYRLGDWKAAQQAVLKGEADVLSVFSPNAKRLANYEFVDSFLQFEMSLFVRSDNIFIHGSSDLTETKVGVTKGSFLVQYLQKNSNATLVSFDSHLAAFNALKSKEIDAVATNKWVGAYSIQKQHIDHIKFVTPPLFIKQTHLGITKGNEQLKHTLTQAINELKQDGTVDRITLQWEKLEIVYLTKDQIDTFFIIITILIFISAVVIIFLLKQQVKHRTASLQESNKALEVTLSTLKNTQHRLVQSEKLSALSVLMIGLSHEINTPLGNAVMMTSLLKNHNSEIYNKIIGQVPKNSKMGKSLTDSSKAIELLDNSLQKLTILMNNFNEVTTQHSFELKSFELSKLLQDSIKLSHHELQAKSVQLDISQLQEIHLTSYPSALKQIFKHLIENSLNHAFDDDHTAKLTFSCEHREKSVLITIRDNGKGISEHDIKKIFDPFFTTHLGQGTSGLGMHVVYVLITGLLGGEISVKNDHGCVICINLPLVPPSN